MTDSKKLDKFVQDCYIELKERNKGEGDYCMILFSGRNQGGAKVISVYKNIEEFKNKVFGDMEYIDAMFDIDFSLWLFD